VYREYFPTQGEIIFTGACEFQCQHCVYPPSYARQNSELTIREWGQILLDIVQGLGIKTFVYGGRSFSLVGLEALVQLRKRFPHINIGLIDNGISLIKYREILHSIRPDWIDISLDGQEQEHDLQRGRVGSFRAGLEGVLWLVRNRVTPKVNILTCLTTLNQKSVLPMIRELNEIGLKNFFITPVMLVDGVRPSSKLRISGEDFFNFTKELLSFLALLDDAWIEINLFSAAYAEYLAQFFPHIWSRLVCEQDSLVWHENSPAKGRFKGSEIYVRYYPTSLTGVREFIVNTNGDVIVPKSIASGKVANEQIAGNLLQKKAIEIAKGFADSAAFNFYLQEFFREQDTLRRYI